MESIFEFRGTIYTATGRFTLAPLKSLVSPLTRQLQTAQCHSLKPRLRESQIKYPPAAILLVTDFNKVSPPTGSPPLLTHPQTRISYAAIHCHIPAPLPTI
jgi:hypothetical protein